MAKRLVQAGGALWAVERAGWVMAVLAVMCLGAAMELLRVKDEAEKPNPDVGPDPAYPKAGEVWNVVDLAAVRERVTALGIRNRRVRTLH